MRDTEFSNGAAETVHRYEFLRPFLKSGFIPYLPEFDAGVDFIIWHEKDNLLLKIQLKSRWTIDIKYFKRNIWIAFPGPGQIDQRIWYVVPHDRMVKLAFDDHGSSESWRQGHYSKGSISKSETIMYAGYESETLIATLKESRSLDHFGKGLATRWEGLDKIHRLAHFS